jgi:hypothetical protein
MVVEGFLYMVELRLEVEVVWSWLSIWIYYSKPKYLIQMEGANSRTVKLLLPLNVQYASDYAAMP